MKSVGHEGPKIIGRIIKPIKESIDEWALPWRIDWYRDTGGVRGWGGYLLSAPTGVYNAMGISLMLTLAYTKSYSLNCLSL